ncbi:hypothetical protein JMUB6875_31900 [Nocardia sp. JMUB6875]
MKNAIVTGVLAAAATAFTVGVAGAEPAVVPPNSAAPPARLDVGPLTLTDDGSMVALTGPDDQMIGAAPLVPAHGDSAPAAAPANEVALVDPGIHEVSDFPLLRQNNGLAGAAVGAVVGGAIGAAAGGLAGTFVGIPLLIVPVAVVPGLLVGGLAGGALGAAVGGGIGAGIGAAIPLRDKPNRSIAGRNTVRVGGALQSEVGYAGHDSPATRAADRKSVGFCRFRVFCGRG